MPNAVQLKGLEGATDVRTITHQDINYIEFYRLSSSPSGRTLAAPRGHGDEAVAYVLATLQRSAVRLTGEQLREAEGDSV
jgi:hypothetical protein